MSVPRLPVLEPPLSALDAAIALHKAYVIMLLNGTSKYRRRAATERAEFEQFVTSKKWGLIIEYLKREAIRAGVKLSDAVVGDSTAFVVRVGEPLSPIEWARVSALQPDLWAAVTRCEVAESVSIETDPLVDAKTLANALGSSTTLNAVRVRLTRIFKPGNLEHLRVKCPGREKRDPEWFYRKNHVLAQLRRRIS